MTEQPKMKLAIVSHAHPSVSKGGAEISAYTLYLGMRALRVPVVFIAAVPHEAMPRVELYTEDEHVLPFDPHRYNHGLHLGSPQMSRQLMRLLREQSISIVNFHHYLHFGLGALRTVHEQTGLPVMLTLHEYLAICAHHGQMVTRPAQSLCNSATIERCASCFPESGRAGMTTRRNLFLEALSRLDGFISPSHFLIDRYVDWGLPRDRFAMIENGLRDIDNPPSPRLRMAGEPMVFAYFGQINPFKGVDVLLSAAELLATDPKFAGRFRIVIHGNVVGLSPTFEQRLAAASEQVFVHIAGPYDNRTIMHLMGEADYVVVPSRWWENSPVVIQEAFAARRPVICSGIGGMAEKVENGISGYHFQPGSAAHLANMMRKAMSEEPLLATNLPRAHGATDMAQNYLALFERYLYPEAQGRAPEGTVDLSQGPTTNLFTTRRKTRGADGR